MQHPQSVPDNFCVIFNIYYKLHENFHFRHVANRYDTVPILGSVKQSSSAWNGLASNLVVLCPTYHENLKIEVLVSVDP